MSLRLRLLAASGAVALVALLAADIVTYSALRSFLLGRIDQQLVTAHLGVERRLATLSASGTPDVGPLAPGAYVELRDAQNHIITTVALAGRIDTIQATPRLPARLSGFRVPGGSQQQATLSFTANATKAGDPQFWVRAWLIPNGDQLIMALPLDEVAATLHRLLAIEAAVTAAALAGAIALGWLAVRVGLRPLVEIETTADAIADGDLDRRVPGDTAHTEVGRLAKTLNTMLGQIQGAFDSRDATEAELRASEARLRRFVADASHELRTPVAAVSAYAELYELGARDRPADLERVITGIRKETARMSELINELLLLARLDEGRDLQREPVELVSLVSEAVEAARAISTDWPVRVQATGPVEVAGDAARLRQVLDNLLGNVRAHTPPGTRTIVKVEHRAGEAVIRVADTGPGLTDTDAGHVFERFYRTDRARTRDHGGSGLGLAIVAAIVKAHDGHVSAASNPGGGAAFTITLPATESLPRRPPVSA